ncbi:hypothetical protein ES707_14260 [subsurface metagenome]
MEIQKINIDKLKPLPFNPKIHPEDQINRIVKSLNEFGFTNPILATKDNYIMAGHGRIDAARKAGISKVPVIYFDFDLNKAKAYNIADNRLAELAEDDMPKLKDLLQELDTGDLDMEAIGYSENELEELMTQFYEPEENEKDDIVPEVPEEPITKLGDLYQLGEHRLLCGDVTKTSDVERLMNGNKADMVFTDPPYGINIVKSGKVGMGGKLGFVGINGEVKAKKYRKIIGDNIQFNPKFLLKYGKNQIIFGGNYFADRLPISSGWIIWDKHGEMNIYSNFSDCELMWSSFDKPARIYRCIWAGLVREGDRKTELKTRVHPTQKPVKLISDILNDYSKRDEIILDLFGGSGSTLIACQKLNRKCYMCEIDPHYCDVIVKRYEDYTGKKAELIGSEIKINS